MIFHRAEQHLLNGNYTPGGNRPRLLIVHIMEGTLAGTDAWFHNPAAQVSAHFGTGKDGRIIQWVNTTDTAWHAANANGYSIGVENEGHAGEKLTAQQVDAVARIYAWAHERHPAIKLWLNRKPPGSGLSWHGLGGAAWGGHTSCPGNPVRAQLPQILTKAKEYAN